ncbi:hypothetical protein ADIS_2432 [Lunatimonas lonarensis]|uniref:Uncharacterized protein n=1 Tax=Lunatimonas lonarensis TaxID=1232681 RepID=R7ZSS7_9BACT|nr:hypothetical protein ADIS_2432 [Lunatimonas lonarensis]
MIFKQLKAYQQVYPNLVLHAAGLPHPDTLFDKVKNGLGDHSRLGEGYDTEASEHIIRIVDDAEGMVHIPVWGGLRELAQALWKVKKGRSPEEVAAFCKKIQVHAIGDQDGHRNYLWSEFKDLRFIASGFAWLGFTGVRELSAFRGMYMTGDVSMQDGDWVRNHIHGNGALSDCYQLHGHGTDGMKEGDSPSFLGLISNGLNSPERPEWGGWGGRFRKIPGSIYVDAPDFLDGTLNERHSVARWRRAFQRDFMARIKWATNSFQEANHPPTVCVNGSTGLDPVVFSVKGGESIRLDAAGSMDVDGDGLGFNWFVYEELFKPSQELFSSSAREDAAILVRIPEDGLAAPVHIILEVQDTGVPQLSSYRRIIFQPEP